MKWSKEIGWHNGKNYFLSVSLNSWHLKMRGLGNILDKHLYVIFLFLHIFSICWRQDVQLNAYFFGVLNRSTWLLKQRVDCRKIYVDLDRVWEARGAKCNGTVSQADCREITRSRNAAWLTLLAQCVSIWDLQVPSKRIPCASLEGLISLGSEPLSSVASWPLCRCVLFKCRMHHSVSADRFIIPCLVDSCIHVCIAVKL